MNVVWKVLGYFSTAKLGQIQDWYRGVKGENLKFEKLSYFSNLMDVQLLSEQVLSRVARYF